MGFYYYFCGDYIVIKNINIILLAIIATLVLSNISWASKFETQKNELLKEVSAQILDPIDRFLRVRNKALLASLLNAQVAHPDQSYVTLTKDYSNILSNFLTDLSVSETDKDKIRANYNNIIRLFHEMTKAATHEHIDFRAKIPGIFAEIMGDKAELEADLEQINISASLIAFFEKILKNKDFISFFDEYDKANTLLTTLSNTYEKELDELTGDKKSNTSSKIARIKNIDTAYKSNLKKYIRNMFIGYFIDQKISQDTINEYKYLFDNLFSKNNPENDILLRGRASGKKAVEFLGPSEVESEKPLLNTAYAPGAWGWPRFFYIDKNSQIRKRFNKYFVPMKAFYYLSLNEPDSDRALRVIEIGQGFTEALNALKLQELTESDKNLIEEFLKGLLSKNNPKNGVLKGAIWATDFEADLLDTPFVAEDFQGIAKKIQLLEQTKAVAARESEIERIKIKQKQLGIQQQKEMERQQEAMRLQQQQEMERMLQEFTLQQQKEMERRLEELRVQQQREIERMREEAQKIAELRASEAKFKEQKIAEEIARSQTKLELELQLRLRQKALAQAKQMRGGRTYLNFYDAFKDEDTRKSNVGLLLRNEYDSTEPKDRINYCVHAFNEIRSTAKDNKILSYSKLRTLDALSANMIAFNNKLPESMLVSQLLPLCMNTSEYADRYFRTLATIKDFPGKKANIEEIEKQLKVSDNHTSNIVWGRDLVKLKGEKWLIDSPNYTDYPRKDPQKPGENFADAWTKAIEDTQNFVDITTLSPPGLGGNYATAQFAEKLRGSLDKLDRKNEPITVRILVGANWDQVHLFDVKKLLEEYTKDLRDDSQLTVILGYWQNLNPFTGQKLVSWNHSKIVASDGKVMVTGGHNLYDAYFDKGSPTHDVSVSIKGNIAKVGHAFAQRLWETIAQIGGRGKFSSSEMCIFSTKDKKKIYDCQVKKLEGFKPARGQLPLPTERDYELTLAVGRLGDAGGAEGYVSDHAILKMIEDAQIALFISQQATLQLFNQTIFNSSVVEGLVKAIVERGVNVFILSSPTDPDVVGAGLTGYTSRHSPAQTWAYLYDIGLGIKDLRDSQNNLLTGDNKSAAIAKAFFEHLQVLHTANANNEMPNHAKVIIADGQVAYIGSHNLYDDSHAEFGVILGPLASEELVSDYFSPLWHASIMHKDKDSWPVQPKDLREYQLGDYVYVLRSPQDELNPSKTQTWTLAEVINNNTKSGGILVSLDPVRNPSEDTDSSSRLRLISDSSMINRAPGYGNSGRKKKVKVPKEVDLSKTYLD